MRSETQQKILVVDDSRVMQVLLVHILHGAGYETSVANDGREALEMIREEGFDFVLTDRCMPVMDGLELCRQVRAQNFPQYVYIAVLTAADETDDVVAALDAGADDFLSKPVVVPEMLARLRTGTRLLSLERRLRTLARVDPLTQLLNRRTYQELIEREWSAAVRYDSPLSCLMLDVDHFKSINDRYGHLAGDATLMQLAKVLQETCRRPDYVCRYGGEEFGILLPNTDLQGALRCAERCLTAIRGHKFLTGVERLSVTASIGIAERTTAIMSPDQLIDDADQALLLAKRQGRNRCVVATEALRELSLNQAGFQTFTQAQLSGPEFEELLALRQQLCPSTLLVSHGD